MRINVLPVNLLTDSHLIAEYREIKMLPKAFLRSMNSKLGLKDIGGSYTLNKGHGKALYDKFLFIETRFSQILKEMSRRHFTTNYNTIDLSYIPKIYMNDYVPTKDALIINSNRIIQRVLEKPNLYKYYGKKLNVEEYIKYLENLTKN